VKRFKVLEDTDDRGFYLLVEVDMASPIYFGPYKDKATATHFRKLLDLVLNEADKAEIPLSGKE